MVDSLSNIQPQLFQDNYSTINFPASQSFHESVEITCLHEGFSCAFRADDEYVFCETVNRRLIGVFGAVFHFSKTFDAHNPLRFVENPPKMRLMFACREFGIE